MFIGTPHLGSDVVKDTREQVKGLLVGTHDFINDSAAQAISHHEFIENIFQNILLSKTTNYLTHPSRLHFYNLHSSFLSHQIPFECVSEGALTHSDQTGLSYMIVKPESALVNGATKSHLVKHKRHSALQKIHSDHGNDLSCQIMFDFIFRNVQEIVDKNTQKK